MSFRPRRRANKSVVALALLSIAALPAPCSAQTASTKESSAATDWTPPESATADELISFIQQLIDREPTGDTQQELLEHQRKVARGIAAAADLALAEKPDAKVAPQLHFYQLQALNVLRRMDEPKATARFEKALALAQRSTVPDVGAIGVKFLVESRMEQWPTIGDQDKRQMIDGVIDHLKRRALESNDAHTIVTVADFLSEQQESELANRLLKGSIPLFRQESSDELGDWLEVLEGVERRVNLPGKKIELTGKLLGGSEFDLSQYQGKVVLVDFWASWCRPCREELPNVKRLYRAYHDKGFEVVGICIDETPEEAAEAVRDLEITWATLFSDDQSKREWKDPRAVRFGVTGIPTAILLDQQHRVVHMNARGEALADQLRQLLGKPLVQLDDRGKNAVQQVSAEE